MSNAKPVRAPRSAFPRRPLRRLPGNPGRRGVDLGRRRGRVGALRAPDTRTGRCARRPYRCAGGEVAARARPLPRLSARRCGLPAAQPGLSGAGAGLLPRRRRAPAGGCAAGIRGRRRGAVRAPRHRRASHARHRGGRHPGRGEPVDAGALRHRGPRPRRPRRAPVHLRHHRQAQGRDAHPRQPVLERAGAARDLGVPRGRHAPAHAPPLPHPRAVRGLPHLAPQRHADDLLPPVRRGRGLSAAAASDGVHGRADVLRAPARADRLRGGAVRERPPVRVRARRRFWSRPSRSSGSAPDTPSSNATA